jgi:cobaltochelatase CobS
MTMKSKLKPKKFAFSDLGPGLPSNRHLWGYEPNEYAPRFNNPYWVWNLDLLRDLVMWWTNGDPASLQLEMPQPVCLSGFSGSGKTSALRNFCALLNIPFYEKTLTPDFDFRALECTRDMFDGTTTTNYGPLPRAMGAEGYPGVLCLNEVDRPETAPLTGAYEVFEGQSYHMTVKAHDIESVIEPVPGFALAGTANSALMGDITGMHGASAQDVALVERFTMKIWVPYPEADVELQILEKATPNLDPQLRQRMVEVANDIRAMHMGETDQADALPLTMSTRTLVAWAKLTWWYREAEKSGISPVMKALELTLLNATRGNNEWREAIEKIVGGIMGEDILSQSPGAAKKEGKAA